MPVTAKQPRSQGLLHQQHTQEMSTPGGRLPANRGGLVSFVLAVTCATTMAGAADLWVDRFDDAASATQCDLVTAYDCSLRGAIIRANSSSFTRIILPQGTYTLSTGSSGEDQAAEGDLDIHSSVSILPLGGATINGAAIDRVFEVHGNHGSLSLVNLEITGGSVADAGGCIQNHDELHLSGVYLHGCMGQVYGGAIDNDGGTVELVGSTLADSSAWNGGGLSNRNNGGVQLKDSTVGPANYAVSSGGGIWNEGGLRLERSTVESNSCNEVNPCNGGGLSNTASGTADIVSSTFANNEAPKGSGGAIYNKGILAIIAVTLSANTAQSADVIHHLGGTMYPETSVFHGTSIATATVYSQGGNVESPGSDLGLIWITDQTNVANPMLAGYGLHGGPTNCFELLPGSPAIDISGSTCPSFDQRSYLRPVDGDGAGGAACDAGAVEHGALSPTIFNDGFESGDLSHWVP